MGKPHKKKVLICIGDTAGGHISAANAITKSFASLYPDKYEIKVMDVYLETDVSPFNNSSGIYVKVSRRDFLEFAYNFIGKLMNTALIYPFYRRFILKKLKEAAKKLIDAYNPDIVIANNAIVTPIIDGIKKEGACWPLAVVVTDISYIFRGWAGRHADLVFSPTDEATKQLLRFKVGKKRIVNHLFPVVPDLAQFRPRKKVLKSLGLAETGKKTVLVTSGGFGVLALEEALEKLVQLPDVQVIILAGRIEEFRTKLEQRFSECPHIRILGFVDNIQDYYNAADIIVGKPGPATIMEMELFNKKAILTRSIGFQEKGNLEYALENPNFRALGDRWDLLPKYIGELLESEQAVFRDRRRFDECDTIVKHIVKLLDKNFKNR